MVLSSLAAPRRLIYISMALVLSLFFLVDPGHAVRANYNVSYLTVTTTADTIAKDGACSLREAIQATNQNSSVKECKYKYSATDTIVFAIPGAGPHTIQLNSALPTISSPVLLDGWSQPGFAGVPLIELRGDHAGSSNGLYITGGSSTVRGLVINGFTKHGISIQNHGNNIIQGNYIGTDASGTIAHANGMNGISIENASNNLVGGTTPAARNIISANCVDGVWIRGTAATGNLVQGNAIGTDASGSADLGNIDDGIEINGASNNTVGGSVAGAGNIIAGNDDEGMQIQGTAATGNLVQGNAIGTDASGTLALGNSDDNVLILDAPGNTVGGTTPETRNIIAAGGSDGIEIRGTAATGNLVQGNAIGTNASGTLALGNSRNGIFIQASGTTIGGTAAGTANVIAYNQHNGISIATGTGNAIRANSIFANHLPGIDLGDNGPTENDVIDSDSGANNLQNYPFVVYAIPDETGISIEGLIYSSANTSLTLEFFGNTECTASGSGQGAQFLGSATVTTDANGDASFQTVLSTALPDGQFVTATATDPHGNTSEFSPCLTVGPGNDTWPRALRLTPTGEGDPLTLEATYQQYLDMPGQARWYKVSVQPGSSLMITLDNLPADYDLVLYKDLEQAYSTLTSSADLVRLSAEYASDGFNPDALIIDALNSQLLAPEAFTPDAFDPDSFASAVIAPRARSPRARSPRARSPRARSPRARSPRARSPNEFSPGLYDPNSPVFDAEAYVSAQSRSFLAFSAEEGTTSETIVVNTWNNTGDFYIRVDGNNGVYSLAAPFRLTVTLMPGQCGSIAPVTTPSTTIATAGNYKTIILTDLERMEGSDEEKRLLAQKLAVFAARSEVAGVVVDVSADGRVAAARAQSDANPACPYAQNLLASSLKEIISSYRDLNPLAYVVLVGNDDVIPFFRYPDQSLLGPEAEYVPPVLDTTASQSSLRLNYILGQDAYGATNDIATQSGSFPVPDLAVGRLVETASDVNTMLDAYLSTSQGVVNRPASTLVTGYDFLEDAARAIQAELQAGLGDGATVNTLIADDDWSFLDERSWTADQLREYLLTQRSDLIYLAGHFDANGALAADHSTVVESFELVESNVDLSNSIIFSSGCHSGYSIVNAHAVPDVTDELDWAQAFAQKGATFIGGTGYQYGDTELLEYSERLYLEFSRQLRTGSGPVALGPALVQAKQTYLATKPVLEEDIDNKTLLIATLFGFPMLSIDLPGQRIQPAPDMSIVGGTTPAPADPGTTLGLEVADINLTPVLETRTQPLADINGTDSYLATYLSGSAGEVVRPGEPILPLETYNVSVPGRVLRGVGFWGGRYSDTPEVIPLLGAATTEVRGVQMAFPTEIFYPPQPWSVNYLDALVDATNGATRLMLTPAQYQSDTASSLTGTLRQYDNMQLRLFYSNNILSYNGNVPALADAPDISQVAASVNGSTVTFRATVTGDPSAGIQAVWVTYTATGGSLAGQWQSLELTRNASDSRLWESTLTLDGTSAQDVRYIVQAVNGVGLVAQATNQGAYYIPGVDPAALPVGTQPTLLTLDAPPTSGPYATDVTFSALLESDGAPLAGETITFQLGGQVQDATSDSNGRATVTFPLFSLPAAYSLNARFGGTDIYAASSAAPAPFTITRQETSLTLTPASATVREGEAPPVVATLQDATGRLLGYQSVFFVISGDGGAYSTSVQTDPLGRAAPGVVPLPPGNYTIAAYFGGLIPLPQGTIDLTDRRYEAATAAGALTIERNDPACELFLNGVPAPLPGETNTWHTAWDPASGPLVDTLLVRLDNISEPVNYRWERTFPTDRSGIPPVEGSGTLPTDGEYTITIDYPPAGEWGTPSADGFGTYESHVTLWISAPCQDQNWDHWYKAPYETDLAVTKTAPQYAHVGDIMEYIIEVSNNGPWNAEVFDGRGVRLEDTLPEGVTVQSITPDQGACQQQGNLVICDLGSINYLATVNVKIAVRVDAPGTLVNSVTVAPERPQDNTPQNNSASATTIVEAGDLCYAEGNQVIVSYTPGRRKNGSAVPPPWRNSSNALGLPQGDTAQHYVSLGFGGSLVVGFNHAITNNNGSAPDIRIWETSRQHRAAPWSSYPEAVRVEVSQDGIAWSKAGTTTNKDQAYDIVLPWVRYVRLTDISNRAAFKQGSADGFDVDAIEVLTACVP